MCRSGRSTCCEGFADGKVGIVGKIHHAVADGLAANAMLANIMDVTSAELRPGFVSDTNQGGLIPSPVQLVRSAVRDGVAQLAIIPGLVKRTWRAVAGMLRYRKHESEGVPVPVKDTPRVSFNGPLTSRRSFATVTLPLADLKAVRSRHADIDGLTLNDVVLALTSGALRRWLEAHGERPTGSLVAGVPVGLDAAGGEPRLIGNNVSNMFTTLATDVDDPAERLRRISVTARHAKVMQQHLGTSLVEWSQFTPPAPVRRLHARLQPARRRAVPRGAVLGHRVERPRPAGAAEDRRRAPGRRVQRRAAGRGHRAQRDGLVVRRPDELLPARLPRPAARRRGARVVLPGRVGRTAGANRRQNQNNGTDEESA